MLKTVKGFPKYLISSDGKVYIKGRDKPLSLFKNPDGYNCLVFTVDGVRTHKRVCRLVAEHFVDNPENKPVVNHKNLVRDDDRFENLEWVTTLENNLHGIENNRAAHRGNATITEDQAKVICEYISAGLRSVDIADITGTPRGVVEHISKKKTWTDVSVNYKFPSKGSRVSMSTARWVRKMLSEGLTYQDILKVTTNSRLSLVVIEMIDKNKAYVELDNPSSTIQKWSTLK